MCGSHSYSHSWLPVVVVVCYSYWTCDGACTAGV